MLSEKLIAIQSELKAPKNQTNSYGGYKYRTAEGILEAAKPLLKAQGCTLIITDDILSIDGRFYVKATATISSEGESISTSAFAREEETKKGMDASQITGSASSYARKYALNGLLCIDDTEDADVTNTGESDEVLGRAVAAANNAASVEELTDIWNRYKEMFGEEKSFKQTVAMKNRKFKGQK